MYGNIYKGKRVMVTGHQGFCGSWLALWLERLGAKVYGYGHNARTDPNHYRLHYGTQLDLPHDLLNYTTLRSFIHAVQPDLIIHLAAKAIVARTFQEPRETFENNIMGAVNLLDATLTPNKKVPEHLKGIVFITTDKVYKDCNWKWGYREVDKLGGDDPYSISKVCLEHIIQCYKENFGVNVAVARAGNVIGGGDWSEKRLIPDIAVAASKGEPVVIHTPNATRPWQHVLEALHGYLLLGQYILRGASFAGENHAYNFGPEGQMTVEEVLETAKMAWPKIEFTVDDTPTHPHMVYLLRLDNTKARSIGWKPIWDMRKAVTRSIQWYRDFYEYKDVNTMKDISKFEGDINYD